MSETPHYTIRYYIKEPISANEASSIAREADGLHSGEVTTGALGSIFLPLQRCKMVLESHGVDPQIEKVFANEDNALLDDLDLDNYNAVRNGYSFASKIKRYVTLSTQTQETTENDGPAMLEAIALKTIYEQYLTEHPDGQLDDTFGKVLDFVDYYVAEIQKEITESGTIELVKQCRTDLVIYLRTKCSKLGSKKDCQRMADEIESTPVVITDPITNLIEEVASDDYLGWFWPERRVAFVDSTAIYRYANRRLMPANTSLTDLDHQPLDITESNKACLRLTLYHELFHAVTNDVYVAWHDDISESMNPKALWPRFIYEAMVEKAAYLAASESDKFISKLPSIKANLGEMEFRNYLGAADIPEVLSNRRVQKQREIFPSVYVGYRMIVDALVAKLDWERAGLDRTAGEKLLIAAFFERPETDSRLANERYPYRKRLNAAITRAGHKGMIAKLAALESMVGTSGILSILLDPNFDPHDPEQLPWIAAPIRQKNLVLNKQTLDKLRSRLNTLKDTGEPECKIKSTIQEIEALKMLEEQQKAFILAREGLDTQIASRHGKIEDDFKTPAYRLLRSMGLAVAHRQRPGEDEIKVANNNVAKYRDKYVRQHRQ